MSTDITANVVVGSISLLTHHNDPARTGANLNEKMLNTSNVKPQTFGKKFECSVDGQIYAQILYVSNVHIRDQGTHNVVYIATMANTVYAFDADDALASEPLWSRNLGPSISLPDQDRHLAGNDYNDISIEIGIVGTPVISLDIKGNAGDGTLYVVAMTKEKDDASNYSSWYKHSLHALDISSGDELFDGPVQITASVAGSKTLIDQTKQPAQTQAQQMTRTFTSFLQNQRSALLLTQNRLFIAFASFEDHDESENNPYHGWIFSYDATTLKQQAVHNMTPNYQVVRGSNRTSVQAQGGIWQAGQGPAADSEGEIFVITGNGLWKPDGSILTDSIVKFNLDLRLLDWFTPFNSQQLTNADEDLGSSGAILLPGTDLVLGGGKESKFYLMHKKQMGHFNPKTDDNRIVQWFYVHLPDGKTHHIHAGPVFWNGPKGMWVYIWPENDVVKAFHFANGRFDVTVTSQGPQGKTVSQGNPLPDSEAGGMPGGALTLSADGNKAGTGIVWASHPHNQQPGKDANQHVVPGILRAYDASDLTRELWNSEMDPKDSNGNLAKFNPPTVANGKVYLASFGRGNIPQNQQITQAQRDQLKTTYHFSVYGLK